METEQSANLMQGCEVVSPCSTPVHGGTGLTHGAGQPAVREIDYSSKAMLGLGKHEYETTVPAKGFKQSRDGLKLRGLLASFTQEDLSLQW